MFGIGPEELVLIFVLALLVIGPDRLPRVARDVGKVVGDLRRTSDELRDEFLNADRYVSSGAAAEKPAVDAPPALAPGASVEPPGETAFDREMREARERLRET